MSASLFLLLFASMWAVVLMIYIALFSGGAGIGSEAEAESQLPAERDVSVSGHVPIKPPVVKHAA